MDTHELNKLTAEAEAGHGHLVRTILDQMPFPDRIRTLRKMQKLSEAHHHLKPEQSYLTYALGGSTDYAYAYARLDLNIPHRAMYGLMDKAEVLYFDYIDLYNGEETIAEGNLSP